MIVPHYYEDPKMFRENVLPDRAYFIPASGRFDDAAEHRERSDRFQLLNGTWRFRYYSSIYELKDRFFEPGYEALDFGTIPVPSVWQNHGYDHHHYVSSRFPFPADPPYVPVDNPCGAYLHTFLYTEDPTAPNVTLNFEGVDSCFYVWLNGTYVGYNQVSHSNSEFDITGLLRQGENLLAVLVLKWCDGSYMEDQDKFRTNGIFRDVYLLRRPTACIRDYFVTTDIREDTALVRVRMAFQGDTVPVSLTLLDHEDALITTEAAHPLTGDEHYTHEAILSIPSPRLWNPESPYLYTLLLESPGEVITEKVGLRYICVDRGVVCLNGNPIKFHGVNRHDSDPVTGPTVDVEHIKRDLQLMREHNVNAIRTSHYPNAPMFYQLCDRYGFLVMGEADMESHGFTRIYNPGPDVRMANKALWHIPMSDNPLYEEATKDRIRRCIQRDKNRPCVVVWSVGNESAYGCCFEAALAWVKAFDPSRITHYEGAQYHGTHRRYDFSNLDLYSNMYPSIEKITRYFDSAPDKPFVLCEYSHSMGNSPGDLEDYFHTFQKYDGLCGGFVWEWCDHAVYKGIADNGKAMYWYGGDHGEEPHDGNVCMDGLVYPDRRPHTGLREHWNVFRPARIVAFDGSSTLTAHNYLDFSSLREALSCTWEVTCDGQVIDFGTVDELPDIQPHGEGRFSLPIVIPARGKCFLIVHWHTKNASPLLPAGFYVGFDEIPLTNEDGRHQQANALWQSGSSEGPINVTQDDRYLTVSGADFTYRLDTGNGLFCEMDMHGIPLLEHPMELNIWRAPTDNDRRIKYQWFDAQYHRAAARAYSTHWKADGNNIQISTELSIAATSFQRFMDIDILWTISPDGVVNAQIHAKRNTLFPMLPRFGLRLFLSNDMEEASYFGIGPDESYRDKRRAGHYGRFDTTVTDLHEDYVRPQENGSHWGCDLLKLSGKDLTLTAVGPQTFSFNASHYTQEELMEKAHNYQLVESGHTVLCLDYEQNGIGSNSVGPALLEDYRLDDPEIHFSIRLIPARRSR